ncbi:hypothetical protein ACHAWF_006413 [Thalassiosira exigua]
MTMTANPLPNETWAEVASYLTCQAVLAVALTPAPAWEDGRTSSASEAVVASMMEATAGGGLDLVHAEDGRQLAALTEEQVRLLLAKCVGGGGSGARSRNLSLSKISDGKGRGAARPNLLGVAMRAAKLLRGEESNEASPSSVDGGSNEIDAAKGLTLANGGLSLDFGEIEPECYHNRYAAALTDEDVRSILLCINAKCTLSRLKLDGCVGIKGHGLEPLRGSTVLDVFDTSMSGSTRVFDPENPERTIKKSPVLSRTVVLPILGSILDANGVALRYLHLYKYRKSWYRSNRASSEFLKRYNQILEGLECSNCSNLVGRLGYDRWTAEQKTCYTCLRRFCNRGECQVRCCRTCKRYHCIQCVAPSEEDSFDSDDFLRDDFESILGRLSTCPTCVKKEGRPCLAYVPREEQTPLSLEETERTMVGLYQNFGYSKEEAAHKAKMLCEEAKEERERESK